MERLSGREGIEADAAGPDCAAAAGDVARVGEPDQPGAGSAAYCSGVNFRHASSILEFAQRLKANSEAKSSCMITFLGQDSDVLMRHISRRSWPTGEQEGAERWRQTLRTGQKKF